MSRPRRGRRADRRHSSRPQHSPLTAQLNSCCYSSCSFRVVAKPAVIHGLMARKSKQLSTSNRSGRRFCHVVEGSVLKICLKN